MTLTEVYLYTCILLSISGGVKAFEMASLKQVLSSQGLFDWDLIGPRWMRASRVSFLFRRIYSAQGMIGLGAASLCCFSGCLLIILGLIDPSFLRIFGLVILGVMVLLYYRQDLGTDGADQMSLLISIAVAVCFCLTNSDVLQKIGILFIAGQLCVSYWASGLSKLLSRSWRQGTAARGVLSTYTYGNSFTRNLLEKFALASLLICWATIGWEVLVVSHFELFFL